MRGLVLTLSFYVSFCFKALCRVHGRMCQWLYHAQGQSSTCHTLSTAELVVWCAEVGNLCYSHGCFESKSILVLHKAPFYENQIPSPLLHLMALQWYRENLKWFVGSLWRAEGSTVFFQAARTWFLNHSLYRDWCCQVRAYVSFHSQLLPPHTLIFASFSLFLRAGEGISLPSSVCWPSNWYQDELCSGLFSVLSLAVVVWPPVMCCNESAPCRHGIN